MSQIYFYFEFFTSIFVSCSIYCWQYLLTPFFVWRGCYSLSCLCTFTFKLSNLYPLYLDIFKADNYILLCKHDCPLCFIENQTSDKLFVSPDKLTLWDDWIFSWWFSSVLTGRISFAKENIASVKFFFFFFFFLSPSVDTL